MSWEWGFQPYVSVAEKRRRAAAAARKLVKGGRPALQPICVEGRTIARSFWGKSWCQNLESYSDYFNRLERGRSYVRCGSVVDLQIAPGTVTALVSGSELYEVSITITPATAPAWKALKKECAGRVGSLIDLLQGKLSAPVMEIMTRRDSGLFPKPAEIRLQCSCPDYADLCKHVAAVLYGVGARLDQSPELLFVLRNADHLELIAEAAESVTAGAAAASAETISADALADVFGIEIDTPGGAPPAPAAARKRVKIPARKTRATAKVGKIRAPKKVKVPAAGSRLRDSAARKRTKPVSKKKSAK